jgi:methylmalonyl-CoA epimerase
VRIRRIHHISVAVHDAEGAARTFEQLFDVRAGESRVVRDFLVRAVDVPFGDTLLQLVQPLPTDNPVRSFLQRKGEGLYNVAVEVDDLDAAIAELAELGVRVSQPIEAEPGIRSSFVTMSATHGLSLQLLEVARDEGEPQIEAVTRIAEPRAEHLPPERHPAAAAAGDWIDREEPPPPSPAGERQPQLDLTPDEWSDED